MTIGSDPSAPHDAGPAGVPARLGRYDLLERIGTGGMAEVFLATASGGRLDARKLVVVKRPLARLPEGYAAMFVDEARLAVRLDHPNVVLTHEVGEHDGSVFIVMEFLQGQPLHRILTAMNKTQTRVPHAYLARIAADALAGLHYAHELTDYDGAPLHIIHRDVSPHNLFVTYDGQVKVVDFGVAKATLNVAQTEVGSLKGKLAYMAPEHAVGEIEIDRRADVFVMGIVLWEMIARQRLITGEASPQLFHRLLNMKFPPLSRIAPEIDADLEAAVERALQRDREARFPTAAAMREALEAYIARSGTPVHHDDIRRFMIELFAEERAAMAATVRRHMAAAGSGSGPVARASLEPPAPAPSDPAASDPAAFGPVETDGGAMASASPATPAAGKTRASALVVPVAAAAAALACVIGVALWPRHSPVVPAAPTPSVAAASAPPATASVLSVSIPSALPAASSAPAIPAVVAVTPARASGKAPSRPPATGKPTRPIDTSFPGE